MKKTRRVRLYIYPWNPVACDLSINFIQKGGNKAFPIYWRGRGKLLRSDCFLIVESKDEGMNVKISEIVLSEPGGFRAFPLNLPDSADYLADAVEQGSKLKLGELQLFYTNWDKIVYIVAKKVPEAKKLRLPRPASKLAATPV